MAFVFGYFLSSGSTLLNRLEKALLVATESCEGIETRLMLAGCRVVRARDGEEAVSHALREGFDAAVLVSTGGKMDLAETALNLRDIRPSMEIFIIGARAGTRSPAEAKLLARSVPNTRVVSPEGLEELIESLKPQEHRRRHSS